MEGEHWELYWIALHFSISFSVSIIRKFIHVVLSLKKCFPVAEDNSTSGFIYISFLFDFGSQRVFIRLEYNPNQEKLNYISLLFSSNMCSGTLHYPRKVFIATKDAKLSLQNDFCRFSDKYKTFKEK